MIQFNSILHSFSGWRTYGNWQTGLMIMMNSYRMVLAELPRSRAWRRVTSVDDTKPTWRRRDESSRSRDKNWNTSRYHVIIRRISRACLYVRTSTTRYDQ